MEQKKIDGNNIQWKKLGDYEHIVYSILAIDDTNTVIDVAFKLEPHKKIVLHRHKALKNSFVFQGEHCFYQPDGGLKEIRTAGNNISNTADDAPHVEYGGDEGAIVLFNIRQSEGVLYELLDEELNTIATLTFQSFIDLHKQEK